MTDKRTNAHRAARFFFALTAYKAYENETPGPDISEDIVDLLVDLHHFTMHHESKIAANTDEAMDAVDNMLVSAVQHFEAEQDNA